MSNIKLFKYDWCWKKNSVTGVLNAKRQPLRTKEDILIFCKNTPLYFPQGLSVCNKLANTGVSARGTQGETTGKIRQTKTGTYKQEMTGYPKNVIDFKTAEKTKHPTQKPVPLFEYLIKTYSNEGDLVLDNCSGSGTTAIACLNTNRNYICIEKDEKYYAESVERVINHVITTNQSLP